jgi:hypothetical protein
VSQSPTKFSRYLRALAVELATHPEWRPGQAAVNVTSLYPEFRDLPSSVYDDGVYEQPTLRTELNPWNHDERVPAFLTALEEHWRTP